MIRSQLFLVSSIALGYTGIIEYKKSLKLYKKVEFSVGSADFMMADNLRTGDIVLFKRSWYNYHIPKALILKAYQYLNNSEFDHCGIIIQNPQTGEPYILELSDKGYKLYYFPSRINDSSSHHILIIPIEPRTDFSNSQINLLHQYIAILQHQSKIEQPYQLQSMLYNIIQIIAIKFSLDTSIIENTFHLSSYPTSMQLVINTLSKLDIIVTKLVSEQDTIRIREDDILHRRVLLSSSDSVLDMLNDKKRLGLDTHFRTR